MIVPILNEHYIINNNGCYIWIKAIHKTGYVVASHRVNGKPGVVYVHKFLWEQKYGKVPLGLELDHTCNIPHCINIEHLEAVTHGENIRRGYVRGTRTPRGINNTKCINGHDYTEANTGVHHGRRECKICVKQRDNNRYKIKKIKDSLRRING